MIKSAIILAGGKGERLRPHTNDKPKPMIPIAGKPIIQYIIEQAAKAGIEEIVFAASYMHHVLQDFVGDGSKFGIQAHFSIEKEPLCRGGGIKRALTFLTDGWEDVFVANGDQIWQLNIAAMVKKHQDRKAIATDLVVPLKSPYGVVEFDDNDQVLGFKEKPVLPHWINGGVYIFNKQIGPLLPDIGDHETETFPKLPKEKFIVFQSTGYWKGIDTIKDLTEAEKEVQELFK